MTTFEYRLDPAPPWASANKRWHAQERARHVKGVRRIVDLDCRAAATAHDGPLPYPGAVRVEFVWRQKTARRRDVDGLGWNAKAVLDGLVDARVLEDDDWTHVRTVTYSIVHEPGRARDVLDVTVVPL